MKTVTVSLAEMRVTEVAPVYEAVDPVPPEVIAQMLEEQERRTMEAIFNGRWPGARPPEPRPPRHPLSVRLEDLT